MILLASRDTVEEFNSRVPQPRFMHGLNSLKDARRKTETRGVTRDQRGTGWQPRLLLQLARSVSDTPGVMINMEEMTWQVSGTPGVASTLPKDTLTRPENNSLGVFLKNLEVRIACESATVDYRGDGEDMSMSLLSPSSWEVEEDPFLDVDERYMLSQQMTEEEERIPGKLRDVPTVPRFTHEVPEAAKGKEPL